MGPINNAIVVVKSSKSLYLTKIARYKGARLEGRRLIGRSLVDLVGNNNNNNNSNIKSIPSLGYKIRYKEERRGGSVS
jgi:hypothetical protein